MTRLSLGLACCVAASTAFMIATGQLESASLPGPWRWVLIIPAARWLWLGAEQFMHSMIDALGGGK